MHILAAFVLRLASAACYDRLYEENGAPIGGRVPWGRWPSYDGLRRAADAYDPGAA